MNSNIKHIMVAFFVGAVAAFLWINPCLAQDAQIYYQMGLQSYGEGEFDLAIEHWKSAASMDPKSAKIHKALGLAYHWKGAGDKDEQKRQGICKVALEEFQKAVSIDPAYASAYSEMAGVCECLGDKDKAIQSYEKAISLDPRLKSSYYYLALIYKQRNEIDKAKQLVKQGDALPAEPLEDTDEGWYIRFLKYLIFKSLQPTLDELR